MVALLNAGCSTEHTCAAVENSGETALHNITMPKKRQQGSDTAVQGTNDSSVLSKVSAATQGYIPDNFLSSFVCKPARRAPLINRGYYVRWKAIDHCVKRFLCVTRGCGRRQIVSLGAGFDSLYFRLHAEAALDSVLLFELDFPDVARRKAALITANNKLREALEDISPMCAGPVFVWSRRYRLLGVDVREHVETEAALHTAGLAQGVPTLVLSEVVLTYMHTHRSDAVIGWLAQLLPKALFVMYEQIQPHDPFGKVMQEHFLKLNSPLHALVHYVDTTAQTRRFLERGWEKCACMDMNQFYLGLVPEEERSRVQSLEPFDEFEEWHLKCCHYFILTASRGALCSRALLSSPANPSLRSPVPCPQPVCPRLLSGGLQGPNAAGLGMAATVLAPGQILLCGGAGRTGRGAEAKVLSRSLERWQSVCVETNTDWGVRLYHTATTVPGWGVVIFGGRSSPLKPVSSTLRVTYQPCGPGSVHLHLEEVTCAGSAPTPRWRHTATLLKHREKTLLFVFGGRSDVDPVLADAHFLCLDDQRWVKVQAGGSIPQARHSHSACPYKGGVVISGGLGREGVPLGDTVLLQPAGSGFHWEELDVQPPLAARYSHSAHVIGQQLVMVGGVWLQTDGVPGVAVIDLFTGSSAEYRLDVSGVPWPLMLHSFCSELADKDGNVLMLMGGGGNCFSFGTHLNPEPVLLDLKSVVQDMQHPAR